LRQPDALILDLTKIVGLSIFGTHYLD
jgi:hypothetical protein